MTCIAQEFVYPGLPGFKIKTDYPVFLPDNLWDFIDGAAEVYLSYGFKDLHVAEYKKRRDVIKLEIYKHSSHTMAFGIYSSERSPSFKFTNLGCTGIQCRWCNKFLQGQLSTLKLKHTQRSLKLYRLLKH